MAAEASIRYQFSEDRARRLFHQTSDDALVTPTESGLRVRGKGSDPFLCGDAIDAELAAVRAVRVSLDGLGHRGLSLKLYFTTDQAPAWCEQQSLEMAIPDADGPVDLTFDLARNPNWRGSWVRLRIDLERMSGPSDEVELRWLELITNPTDVRDIRLPAAAPRGSEPFHLLLDLGGEGLAITVPEVSTSLGVRSRPHPERFRSEGGAGPVRVAWELAAPNPGLHTVTIAPLGQSGRLMVDVWVRDPSGEPRELAPGLTLAEELLVISVNGMIAARIVPMVTLVTGDERSRRSVIVPLTRSVEVENGVAVMAGARRLKGVEVRAELRVGPRGEGHVPYRATLSSSVPLPVFDVQLPRFLVGSGGSGRDLALLPGVEMLGPRDLPDSANVLPYEEKVSWPCVFLHRSGESCGVTWHGTPVQALWMSPDLRGGSSEHTLGLHWPLREERTLICPASASLESPISLEGVILTSERGAGRALVAIGRSIDSAELQVDAKAVAVASADALATTFRSEDGLTLPRVGAPEEERYFEPRSVLSLLALSRLGWAEHESTARRELERFVESESEGQMPLNVGLLFPEHLPAAVQNIGARVEMLEEGQRDDGTWDPRVPPGCFVPFPERLTRTAAAVAEPTTTLLQGYLLGLAREDPVRRSLARLRDPELLPTGAQAWEFAARVVEVLGAGAVADVWLLAHEAGLAEDGRELALDWLGLGTTFFRLRHGHAEEPYACFPALGVTRDESDGVLWYTHAPWDRLDWRGVSCPWVGLRFSGCLERFRAGATADSLEGELFSLLSRGALAHAVAHLRQDGSLPDGYRLRLGVDSEPLYRAPLDVAWHALALTGCTLDAGWARGEGFVAVGVGRFTRRESSLVFEPAVPGQQALLLRGDVELVAPGGPVEARELRAGLTYSVIDGSGSVEIRPR